MATPSLVRHTSACRRETLESLITTSTSGLRPMTNGASPTLKERPSLEMSRGWLSPPRNSVLTSTFRLDVVINEDLDLDGTHEAEALADGVLTDCLFEFAHEGLLEAIESLGVDRSEPHANLIR